MDRRTTRAGYEKTKDRKGYYSCKNLEKAGTKKVGDHQTSPPLDGRGGTTATTVHFLGFTGCGTGAVGAVSTSRRIEGWACLQKRISMAVTVRSHKIAVSHSSCSTRALSVPKVLWHVRTTHLKLWVDSGTVV